MNKNEIKLRTIIREELKKQLKEEINWDEQDVDAIDGLYSDSKKLVEKQIEKFSKSLNENLKTIAKKYFPKLNPTEVVEDMIEDWRESGDIEEFVLDIFN